MITVLVVNYLVRNVTKEGHHPSLRVIYRKGRGGVGVCVTNTGLRVSSQRPILYIIDHLSLSGQTRILFVGRSTIYWNSPIKGVEV